jgi:hypothetical protein
MINFFKISSLVILSFLIGGCSSYEDCLLDVSKNAKSNYAAKIGYDACKEKYGRQ